MQRVTALRHLALRIRGRGRLIALCVAVSVLETMIVSTIAPTALGLATQGSAPPPFDLFHDLRWIVVYHETWLGFALELVGFVVARSALIATLVRAAWPREVPTEPWAVTLRRSVIYVVAVTVLLTPWVGLMFALAVVSLSWLFFVAVPVVLMLSVLVAGGAVSGAAWRRTISWRTAGVVLLVFLAVTVFASVITTCAPPWRLPVAVLAGAVNAWLWVRLVAAVLQPRVRPKHVPVALIGIVGVFALVIGGTVAGFKLSGRSVARFAAPEAAASTGDDWRPAGVSSQTPLLVVTGFNTEWDGTASQFVQLNLPQRRFSYHGMVDEAPMPYTSADTHRSLRDLARELRAQVDAYHRATGVPITIVAESEGALLAKAYLAASPRAPVRNLVVLSPLVEPGRVYYPRSGQEGWGAFGGLELEGLAWALGGLSPVDVTPDTPFLRSIVDDAPAFRGLMSCALPGVRQAAVLPLDTGVSAPAPDLLGIPFTVVPAFHGGMLDDATTASIVERVIRGRPLPGSEGWSWAEELIRSGASAWQVPGLARDVNDAWSSDPRADDCPAIRAQLHEWMATSTTQ
jgi:hypothetical protein